MGRGLHRGPPGLSSVSVAFPCSIGYSSGGRCGELVPCLSPEAGFRGACDQELDEISPVDVTEIVDVVVFFHRGDHVAEIVPVLFVRQLRAEAARKKSKDRYRCDRGPGVQLHCCCSSWIRTCTWCRRGVLSVKVFQRQRVVADLPRPKAPTAQQDFLILCMYVNEASTQGSHRIKDTKTKLCSKSTTETMECTGLYTYLFDVPEVEL